MRRFVLRRVATLAVTLLLVSVLVFLVVRVLPGDPALIIVGIEPSAISTAMRSFTSPWSSLAP